MNSSILSARPSSLVEPARPMASAQTNDDLPVGFGVRVHRLGFGVRVNVLGFGVRVNVLGFGVRVNVLGYGV